MNRILLVGALTLAALAPAMQAQVRTQPRPSRPKPQPPVEIPPAVVVLQVDTTPGDSTRTIIQRDLDYGDRVQPLILDDATLADIWQPGVKQINFAPLAQTRANYVLRACPSADGYTARRFCLRAGRDQRLDRARLGRTRAQARHPRGQRRDRALDHRR